jgi:hypothetical protein
MAYESKPIRIIGNGLNLIGSSDTIGDDEAVELVNWSQDSEGALHSRRGHINLYSVASPVTSVTRGLGSLWIAAGGSVYKDGAAVAGAGVPCSLVSYKGFVWIMFPGTPMKTDGSNVWRWIPVAPTGKPTTKAVPGPTAQVVDFSAGFTVDPTGDDLYNPTLQLNVSGPIAYTATKTIGVDLSGNGDTGGLFKIVVWCKQWAKVDSLAFDIDLNDGSFTTDVASASFSQNDIQGGAKEEITLYIRKFPMSVDQAVQDSNHWGVFKRIGQTPNKGYQTAVKVRVKASFNDTTKLRWESWDLIGDIDSTLEGIDLAWYYTFQTDAGHESNPAPVTDPLVINRGQGEIDGMDVSGDFQVTKKNIYRDGGTLPDVLRVKNDTTTNGATSYIDGNSDNALTALDIPLENDHDDPPSVGGLIGPFFERLIAFGLGKIFWSHINKPYAFAGPTKEVGDWTGVDEKVGDLIAATMRPGTISFYGTAGIAVLQGDPGGLSSALHTGAASIGIQNPMAVCKAPNADFLISAGGVYATQGGDSAELLSKKVQPGMQSGFNSGGIGWFKNVVWASDGSKTFKLDLMTGRWYQDSRLFQAFYSDANGLLGILASGQAVTLEQGFADNGAGIPLAFTSKAFDAGLLSDEKKFADFDIVADTGGATLTVVAILEEPDESVLLGTISGSKQEFRLTFNPDGEGIDARKCSIRITGTTAGAEVIIYSMNLWYYPKAREGKSFDTAELRLGNGKMASLLELLLDVDNPASVGITVKSDRPQPMANRSTSFTLAPTSDRRIEPIVFPSGIFGRLHRIVLHGEGFRSYGGKALFEVLGTYLEGGKGEYYFTDPIDAGTEQVKLFKEIEITGQNFGSALVTLATDLPGGVIATRQTWSIGPNPTEESFKLRVNPWIKGRLWTLRIDPTADFRLEAVRFFIKIVGRPNATPWAWLDGPVTATQDAIWTDFTFNQDSPG